MSAEYKKTILLVEDEAIIALQETKQLKKAGYHVIHALNGETAIEAVSSSPGSVDLILMDIDLGKGMSGTQAAERILRTNDIPVLFLFSHTEPEIVHKTEKITNYGYVVKASSFTVLDASIKMALKLFSASRQLDLNSVELEHANEELQSSLASLQKANHQLAQHESEILERQKYLETLLNTTRDGFYIINEDGRFLEMNTAYCQITGYSREELLQLRLWDIIDTMYQEKIQSRVSMIKKTGFQHFDSTIRTRAGSLAIVEVSSSWIPPYKHFASFCRNITSKKEGEKKLAESESQFSAFMDYLPAVLFLKDAQGKTLFTNKYMDNALGSSEWQGKTMAEVFPNAFGEKLLADDLDTLKTGYKIIEEAVPHLDGTIHLYETKKFAIHKSKNESLIGGFSLDITERNLAEQKVKALLAEKTLILKEVHHRIKNNLGIVTSLLRVQAGLVKERSAVDALADAMNRVQSMMVLYDKLYQSVSYNIVQVDEYIPALVDEIFENFPSRHNVKVAKVVQVFSLDSQKLQTIGIIISELLTNSMKHAFVGRDKGQMTVSATNSNGHIEVSIQDNGVGMPPEIDSGHSGGFGLTLVEQLAKQLEGTIRIERGNGTKVVLEFDM